MRQLTFAEAEHTHKKKRTRREEFLEKMDALILWQKLEKKLAKRYLKGKSGRPQYPLSTMLRRPHRAAAVNAIRRCAKPGSARSTILG